MTSEYFEKLDVAEKKTYTAKLTLRNGMQLPDPFTLESADWSDDITHLPEISWRDVTGYLLDTPSSFTKESMKAYKSLEAFDYFVCRHVQDCSYNKISDDSEFCFIKSEVLPSQRQGQKTAMYKVWVCLNKAHGWVLTGHCTCMAGLGSACSHIAALLFKLEAAAHFHLNQATASTSQLCAWKASRTHVLPAPLSAIDFSRPRKKTLPKDQKKIAEPRSCSYMDPTVGDDGIPILMFKKLHSIYPKAAVFTSLPLYDITDTEYQVEKHHHTSTQCDSDTDTDIENDPSILPEPLTSLFDPTAINMTDDKLIKYGKKLYDEYCSRNYQKSYDNLYRQTKDQSANTAWMLHRAGRITGSTVKSVARMKNSRSVIETIMQYKPGFTSKYTEYGKKMEAVAIKKFVREESVKHKNFKVEKCGIIINTDMPHLGATPDGIVTCDCHGKGVLEIKCPYNYKDSLSGWADDKKFPFDAQHKIKKNHQYYYQTQLQMELAGVEFGYFYVYSAGENEGLLSIIKRNYDFVKDTKDILLSKFLSVLLPEIVSRKLDVSQKHDRELFCICNKPKFGNMIKCTDLSCKIVNYHYSCVNIKRAPRGNWICLTCKDLRKA